MLVVVVVAYLQVLLVGALQERVVPELVQLEITMLALALRTQAMVVVGPVRQLVQPVRVVLGLSFSNTTWR
jgi:hypothetical protein